MIKVEGLDAGYGDVQVLWDVNLEVNKGEIVALIGPNGAGKTTFLHTLVGLVKPTKGQIFLDGNSIVGMLGWKTVENGISLVPEGRRLFVGMTVRDNVLMGGYVRRKSGKQLRADLQKIFAYFPILQERQGQLAGKLSGGEQQMCAIARGLMSNPMLLLIDEFSLGLAPLMVENLVDIVLAIHKEGKTILIVEQDVLTALNISKRGYIIETGRIVMTGESKVLIQDEKVKRSYLGM